LSGGLALRHNSHFDNLIFHTSPHSVSTTSDKNHESALEQGLHVLAHNPLGLGPGTAGPASVYNHNGPVRLAENYFVQIGEETGWLGLALFIAINVVVGLALWRARANPLALALWASLIGISFVGLLSHIWSDDSLCYIWWGLAGIALSPYLKLAQKKEHS
jgi:O-antigen ligase